MKQPKHVGRRGGSSKPALSANAKNDPVARKIINKKGGITGNFLRENLEQRHKHEALLEQWGVTEQELKESWEQNEVSVREAAYNASVDDELCQKFIGRLARKSAERTGNTIGGIRDRYETIVLELLAARYAGADEKRYSLGSVLRGEYETDTALKEFLRKFGKWIGEYVSDCVREHSFRFTPLYRQVVPRRTWTLRGHNVTKELLTALAEEYVRDRDGLINFLKAIFEHWRKIFESQSLWRRKLITHQHATHVPHHQIVQNLERVGAVPKGSAVPWAKDYASFRNKIKKDRSRDPKKALKS